MNRSRSLLLVLPILLAACGSTPLATPSLPTAVLLMDTLQPSQAAVAVTVLPATPAHPTQESTPTETPLPPAADQPAGLPSPTVEALQLSPTAVPEPETVYRAPLYPIPWAIGPHDHFYFAAPIAAAYPGNPIWDYRYGGIYFGPTIIHTGIDIPAPRGTDVLAAGPGTVVWAGIGLYSGSPTNLKDPYGNAVAIRHDFGYQGQQLYTIYAHMEEIDVVVGQWLNTGDVVGKVGSTGNTTGPHLHFEIRLGKDDFFFTRNPELWIAPPLGDGVLVGRVMDKYGTPLDSHIVMMKNLDTKENYNAYTYGPEVANPDNYYNENVVIGEIPAGVYELNIPYGAYNRIVNVQILPGQVTYFTFNGFNGFDFSLPKTKTTPTP